MVYILGAGGMARETFGVYFDKGQEARVEGFLVESGYEGGLDSLMGLPVVVITDASVVELRGRPFVAGIGSPLRRRFVERCLEMGMLPERCLHRDIGRLRWIRLGAGCVIMAGAVLTTQVDVGDHVILNVGCSVSHDVSIGPYTTVSPGAHLLGRVHVGASCFIGAGAVIREDVHVGDRSFVGAGAVVVSDVPDDTLTMGVPAKAVRVLSPDDWRGLI